MRTSVLYCEEAEREVKSFIGDRTDLYVRKDDADCKDFPCPDELDTWSGTTNAFYVEDENGNELFACAYWLEF